MSGSQDETEDASDWLNKARLSCRVCRNVMERIDHSPMYDCWFFQCENCPAIVEVEFYDPRVMAWQQQHGWLTNDGWSRALVQTIEGNLRACGCGGSFGMSAPKRCFACGEIVLEGDLAEGTDLFPTFDTADAEVEHGEWVRLFCRDIDVWKS